MTEWIKIKSGNPKLQCIYKNDSENVGFTNWTKDSPLFDSCQSCSTCSGQNCPSLAQDREFYKLGTLKSIKASPSLSVQPYTFPLPFDQGTPVTINENILPWLRSS